MFSLSQKPILFFTKNQPRLLLLQQLHQDRLVYKKGFPLFVKDSKWKNSNSTRCWEFVPADEYLWWMKRLGCGSVAACVDGYSVYCSLCSGAAAVHYPPRPLGPQLKAVSCLLLPLTSVQFYCHWPRSNEARFDKFSCKECFKMVKRKKRDPNVYMKRMAKKPFPIDNWGIMFWTNPIEWSVT